MRRIAGISIEFVNQLVFWSTLLVLCVLTASVPAMASNKSSCESANRIALSTYCSEAHRESALLANGSTSYIHVINRASEPWKSIRISVLTFRPGKRELARSSINMATKICTSFAVKIQTESSDYRERLKRGWIISAPAQNQISAFSSEYWF